MILISNDLDQTPYPRPDRRAATAASGPTEALLPDQGLQLVGATERIGTGSAATVRLDRETIPRSPVWMLDPAALGNTLPA